jgi:hypothetical protein
MLFSLRPDMCYIFVQMTFPVFHEFDADGTILLTQNQHLAPAHNKPKEASITHVMDPEACQ